MDNYTWPSHQHIIWNKSSGIQNIHRFTIGKMHMPINPNNWLIIPTEIIEEMAEAYGMTAGEILYLIGMDEMPPDMKEALEALLEDTQV